MIPAKFQNRHFYHFTHVDNIESILDNGLISTNEKYKKEINHVNVANQGIQERRSSTQVPCAPHGNIHDYVPFYFAATNPMLLSVLNSKNVDQIDIVYIVLKISKLSNDNVVFTDASVNTKVIPNFFNDPQHLDRLNWNLIDSKKWKTPSKDELHARMAEVLVHKEVPLDWIESFVVFNKTSKKKIKKLLEERDLEKPKIEYEPYDINLFFTKVFFEGRKNESLITGPRMLKDEYHEVIDSVIEDRATNTIANPSFQTVKDALQKIRSNFCVIPELEGINNLETKNDVHSNKVCEHTKDVVNQLVSIDHYDKLTKDDKLIVKLAAYFHDIGKGPKSKWRDGIQPVYADHPADSLKMLHRILVNEFETLLVNEIKSICLLVAYHDLIGDIIGKGRSEKELRDLKLTKRELNMLIAISLADIKSISNYWYSKVKESIPQLIDSL
ncbi:DUF4433 domain-containing protein [Cohnella sp. LGH]|uniref:type II toxin-antitoxin system toxin DNA ADP-ribosyl transferase DarT n=1 Tax=Cohnella sp. LGH TaxID=1619153 RepID=UPI001ADB5806|nr:DarT ssDNA thymidine ADP-ribosyltransferase family protein [Cohnella sp. LGH]QTH40899.1 DUF4433 domain-containing protein [Cohnella sp. LGH]